MNRPGFFCDSCCLYDLNNEELSIDCLGKTWQKKDEKGFYLAINGKNIICLIIIEIEKLW